VTATILLVEDDPTSLALMKYLLDKAGYHPHTEVDGAAGLAAALRLRPELVLMDVQMPVMDGLAAASAIRNEAVLRETIVVAVTAFAMMGDRERVLAAGFAGYITKPIVPERFVREVEEFIAPERRSGIRLGNPPSSEEPAIEHHPPRPPRLSGSVVVVDDVAANIQLLESVLRPMGFEVRSASGIAEGLAFIRERRADVVISDVHMSDGSGYDLLAELRADDDLRDVPVMLISSSSNATDERRRAIEAGADAFLLRPIDPLDLVERIEAVLRDARRSA